MAIGRWTSVSLPRKLVREIEEVVDKGTSGYTSIAEFVKDSVRRRLEELKREPFENPRGDGNES